MNTFPEPLCVKLAAQYVIWSNEQGLWWAPRRRGYVPFFGQAGRYGEAEAREITAEGNRYRDRNMEPNEVAIAITATIDWPK